MAQARRGSRDLGEQSGQISTCHRGHSLQAEPTCASKACQGSVPDLLVRLMKKAILAVFAVVACIVALSSCADHKPRRWEYATLEVRLEKSGSMEAAWFQGGKHFSAGKLTELAAVLEKEGLVTNPIGKMFETSVGEQGWELVSFVEAPGPPERSTWIFKRPLP